MNSERFFAWCLVSGLVVAMAGCGKGSDRLPTHPASGTVLFGGRPAVGAIVILHPEGAAPDGMVKPRGKVGEDGIYRLTTYETGDGAPEGTYVATLYWPAPGPPGSPDLDDGPDRLGGRYLDPARPLARVRIAPGTNSLEAMRLIK